MQFEWLEFGEKPFRFVKSEEKLNEVLSYLLRLGEFKQYADKRISNNVYMNLDMLCRKIQFIIDKGEQGRMEIELDTYAQGISVSYSGNKKVMEAILKDIHRFYGVSQADIEHKTDRYKALVAVLSA